MKIIETSGGPFVGVPRGCLHLWLGVDGRQFAKPSTGYASDYSAAGKLTSGIDHPPCDAAILDGVACQAILLSRSLETAVIASDGISAHLAQIEYAEPDWTFSNLTMDDFEGAMVSASMNGTCQILDEAMIFFDSAYPGAEIADDYISLNLESGSYQVESNGFCPDNQTGLILFRISKIDKCRSSILDRFSTW